jgi:hypothetical protein
VAAEWKGNNLADVKTMWQNVFKTRKTEMFNANPDLWKQFDRIGGGKIEDVEDFIELVDHSSFKIDHPFFDFIKVQ